MKENDGRGARRKLYRKLGLVVGSSFMLLLILVMIRHRASSDGVLTSRRAGSTSSLRPRSSSSFLKNIRDAAALGGSFYEASSEDLVKDVVAGHVNLINLVVHDQSALFQAHPGSYAGITAVFCKLNWQAHKDDPSSTPMFRDLQQKSTDCVQPRRMDLKKAADAAREYDLKREEEQNSSVRSNAAAAVGPKTLNLTAAVFHESRCGSTLIANMCVAANPTQHRVYSESPPPVMALKVCGESYERCSLETAAAVLKDVVYLMSRSDDPKEERVFFKIQSLGTRSVEVWQEAFPTTPWLFVYREPVQVMMSQIANGVKAANCVRSQIHAGKIATTIARKHGHRGVVSTMKHIDYCALHLATITETAADHLNEYAIPVNYNELPGAFYESILPDILGEPLSPEDVARIEHTAQQYSKGRGKKAGEFHEDSERKDAGANAAVRRAADTYLMESYNELEAAAAKRRRGQQ